jgi:hypothetical protein
MRSRTILAPSTIVATFAGGCVVARKAVIDGRANPANGGNVLLSGTSG